MTIMLRLKNIKIGNGKAEADFYPEESKKPGHIVVSLDSKEIVVCEGVPGYGESYLGHAKQHLIKMAKENNKATERTVMWC